MVQHRRLRPAGIWPLGTSGRNILRGPGVNNLDLAAFKNFGSGTAPRLQFRLESFNVLNHTQFNGACDEHDATIFGVSPRRAPVGINQLGVEVLVLSRLVPWPASAERS